MAPKREGGVVGKGHNETAKKSKLSKPAKYTENNKKAANFTTKAPKKKLKKTIKICSKTINYSLCIPVSVIDNCKNLEQATHVVYQIAKSAVLFNVGEIVVLDLGRAEDVPKEPRHRFQMSPVLLVASLLQYFVTPPYLVKSVFKKEYQECFKVAAKLPRITALPFMRHLHEDNGRYREGLAVRMQRPAQGARPAKKKAYDQTKYVNVGKGGALELRGQLVPANVRVTVDLIDRKVVSPAEAYGDFVGAQASYGFHVRVAKTFADIFTQSPAPNGYTQTVWVNSGDFYFDPTTKKSLKLETKIPRIGKILKPTPEEVASGEAENPAHLLVVLGKWDHLKKSFTRSREMFAGCEGAHQFFDGQLELPGSAPEANIGIHDSCMIAMTMLASL